MPVSPLQDAEGPPRVVLYAGDKRLDDVALISLTVRQAFNELPWARLVLQDGGEAFSGEFPLSDGPLLAPGAAVRVAAGYGRKEDTLFTGVVLGHGLRLDQGPARLLLDCGARAARLAEGRRSALHRQGGDAELLAALITARGLRAEVSALASTWHEALVQQDCSDWDWLLDRANALGLLVDVQDDLVQLQPPAGDAAAVLGLSWGADLMAFEATLDARGQWPTVQTAGWDPQWQQMLESTPQRGPLLNTQGRPEDMPEPAALGTEPLRLRRSAPQPEEALAAQAQALQMRAALARRCGRLRFQGSALARPGAVVKLSGVGRRFGGPALLSAVQQQFDAEAGWITEAEFGLPARPAVREPGAALGLQIGVVEAVDGDTAGAHRLRVRPVSGGLGVNGTPGAEGLWVRQSLPQASADAGLLLRPEPGDEVLLGFLDNEASHPVMLGSLYSSRRPPPALQAGSALLTRGGLRLVLDDAGQALSLSSAQGHRLRLSDAPADGGVLLEDRHGNRLQLSAEGITLLSAKDLLLQAPAGSVRVQAMSALALQAQGDLELSGLNVNCRGQVGVSAVGGLSAELASAGQTVVKGGLVMLG